MLFNLNVIIIILTFFFTKNSFCHLKIWNQNNNFGNVNNWNLKRIPCQSDRIKFSENIAVFVDDIIEASEIVS